MTTPHDKHHREHVSEATSAVHFELSNNLGFVGSGVAEMSLDFGDTVEQDSTLKADINCRSTCARREAGQRGVQSNPVRNRVDATCTELFGSAGVVCGVFFN